MGVPIELDFFYPNLNLAFEYHGKQHYNKVMTFLHNVRSFDERKAQDINKVLDCKNKGITLVEIPYWWNNKEESLKSTIHLQRPDLFDISSSSPIPLDPPRLQHKKIDSSSSSSISKILMTSTIWDNSNNPTGWWMSEKFDGMRFYWNGSSLLTRQGNKINAPKSITDQLPSNVFLDGELW